MLGVTFANQFSRYFQIAAVTLFFTIGDFWALAAEEPPDLADRIAAGTLPPIYERLPKQPLLVELQEQGFEVGRYGGSLRSLITSAGDTRYLTVWGYARLVGYAPDFRIQPDILRDVQISEGRSFTLHLRNGHKWSDGHPFTSEDFRYFWEDIENNPDLRPAGPLAALAVDGQMPTVEIIDALTVRYVWSKPNPSFLPLLAQARPPFIYRPAHYLKQFHERYGNPAFIAKRIETANARNWAQLHNKLDSMYHADNPELPTLQPWINKSETPSDQAVFKRNPFFHRVDSAGQQLPYIGEVVLSVVRPEDILKLSIAQRSDIQATGLTFSHFARLKVGEFDGADYRTLLWPIGKAAFLALYPNLNATDEVWRKLLRQPDFRRALSIAVDRNEINNTFFLGLARPVGNSILPSSPLFDSELATRWSEFDIDHANKILDTLGLMKRDEEGYRLLPDGRRATVLVESAGELAEEAEILEHVASSWKKIGIDLLVNVSNRQIMRERSYSGQSIMSAWQGWDIGSPTEQTKPSELAPTRQDNLSWPKWGQHHQTGGLAGEAPDMNIANSLKGLHDDWLSAASGDQQAAIWQNMLQIHADQQFVIGLISSVVQPVLVSKSLRNLPKKAIYSWEPGALFGIYRPDQFWFSD